VKDYLGSIFLEYPIDPPGVSNVADDSGEVDVRECLFDLVFYVKKAVFAPSK
jgi:hypothetical protein